LGNHLKLNPKDQVDPLDIAPEAGRYWLKDRLNIRYDNEFTEESR